MPVDDNQSRCLHHRKRKQAMEMLSMGLVGKVESVFGKKFPIKPNHQGNKAALEELRLKSERAQPKSTLKNPLYTNFGKKGGNQDKPVPAQVEPMHWKNKCESRKGRKGHRCKGIASS